MIPRFVIRHPDISRSPRDLAHELGILSRVARPGREARWSDPHRDFFMYYPPPPLVRGDLGTYLPLYEFFSANKRDQRRELAHHGLPVPEEPFLGQEGPWVVRPLRHSHGHGWRVSGHFDWNPGTHYGAKLFPKTNEYRVIYVLGRPIIILRKTAAEGHHLRIEEPWNYGNTTFRTLEDHGRCNLAVHTGCFQLLGECPIIQQAHYVGVDVMYNRHDHSWVICEFNVSPALQIDDNRRRVAETIQAFES